jgi:hypothetical protein
VVGGQARWKNWPGCAVMAMGPARSLMRLYSWFICSLLMISQIFSAILNGFVIGLQSHGNQRIKVFCFFFSKKKRFLAF